MASSGASSSSIVESPPSGPYVILAQSWIVSPFSSHLTEGVVSAEGCGSRDSLRTLVSAVPGLRCSAILMPPIRFARSAFGGLIDWQPTAALLLPLAAVVAVFHVDSLS